MEITGTQHIPALRQTVWSALNDPTVLKQCLPGCESVEQISPQEFRVVVATAIGPLRARFNGTLRMTEADPPQSCVMVFEGQGGAVGFGKGSSSVTLRETPEGTELTYSAKAQVGGKLAQVGSRLIDSVARKMSDDFFKAFRAQLVPETASGPAAGQAAPERSRAVPNASAVTSAPLAVPGLSRASGVLPAQHGANNTIMVPGWWLAVACVLGAGATLAGALMVH